MRYQKYRLNYRKHESAEIDLTMEEKVKEYLKKLLEDMTQNASTSTQKPAKAELLASSHLFQKKKMPENKPPLKDKFTLQSMFEEELKKGGKIKEMPVKEKPFYKDVILLKNKHQTKSLSLKDKECEGGKGLVIEGFKIDRNWTSEKLKEEVCKKFEDQLGIFNEITLLKQSSSDTSKLRPFFSKDTTGELVYLKCPGDLYVSPKYHLFDNDSEHNTEKVDDENADQISLMSDKSDEEAISDPDEREVFKPKKRKTTSVSLPLNKDLSSQMSDKDDVLPPKIMKKSDVPTISGILTCIRKSLQEPAYLLEVSRADVLTTLINEIEAIGNRKLLVRFKNENAVGSGLLKEMLSLALLQLKALDLWEGDEYVKTLKKHRPSLEAGMYRKMGMICCLSLVHGGPSPTFFSPAFTALLLEKPYKLTPADVLNENIKAEILATLQSKTVAEINCVMASAQIFSNSGTYEQVSEDNVSFAKTRAIEDALEYMCRGRIKEEVESFGKGLNEHFQLLDKLKLAANGEELFLHSRNAYPLTAESLLNLYSVTNEVTKSRTYQFFSQYLRDAENKRNNVNHSLEQILFFSCGVTNVPPLGFGCSAPRLTVKDIYFPRSGICFNEFQLPGLVSEYEEFLVVMDTGLLVSELEG